MSLDIHTIAVLDGGAGMARQDRVLSMFLPGLTYGVGAAAGASVSIPVVARALPAKYMVHVSPDQDATWYVTKTATGFTIVLSPRLAANTLAAGSVDVTVFA